MKKWIAHRGLKINHAKENTLPAFLNAIKSEQYAGFECDIRTTKDHVFVIHHNPIRQMQRISNSLYRTLRKKYEIPSLKQVLELKSQKIFLLEIKEENVNCEALNRLLNQYSNRQIYVMSFHNSVIKKLANLKHTYKLGVLNYVLNSEEDYKNYDFICLLESIYTEKLGQYFKDKNIEVFLYGIHNESTYKNLNHLYLITDKIIYK